MRFGPGCGCCGCCGCATYPDAWTIDWPALTGSYCGARACPTGFADIELTHGIAGFSECLDADCSWASGNVGPFCNPSYPGEGAALCCDETDFILEISLDTNPGDELSAVYKKSRASWDCMDVNTMDLDSFVGACTWPATIDITPV